MSDGRRTASRHPSTLASAPASTTLWSYERASERASDSAKRSAGPATKPAGCARRSLVPSAMRCVARAAAPRAATDHALSDGLTATARPRSASNAVHGTPCSMPVGTMTSGRSDRRTDAGSSSAASAVVASSSIAIAAARDASDPCARLRRWSANEHASRCSPSASVEPSRWSLVRPRSALTATRAPPTLAYATSWWSPRAERSAMASATARSVVVNAPRPVVRSPRARRARPRIVRSTRSRSSSAARRSLDRRVRIVDERVEATELGQLLGHRCVVGRAHERRRATPSCASPRCGAAARAAGRRRRPAGRRSRSARRRAARRATGSPANPARPGPPGPPADRPSPSAGRRPGGPDARRAARARG